MVDRFSSKTQAITGALYYEPDQTSSISVGLEMSSSSEDWFVRNRPTKDPTVPPPKVSAAKIARKKKTERVTITTLSPERKVQGYMIHL